MIQLLINAFPFFSTPLLAAHPCWFGWQQLCNGNGTLKVQNICRDGYGLQATWTGNGTVCLPGMFKRDYMIITGELPTCGHGPSVVVGSASLCTLNGWTHQMLNGGWSTHKSPHQEGTCIGESHLTDNSCYWHCSEWFTNKNTNTPSLWIYVMCALTSAWCPMVDHNDCTSHLTYTLCICICKMNFQCVFLHNHVKSCEILWKPLKIHWFAQQNLT